MPYKVITIAQQKGGAGKTTIAAHLAVAFAQRGKRVTAIDIDPQGSLTQWHALRKEKYGADYTGMKFISISGWRLHSEINAIKDEADVIIVDSPPHTQSETKTAIRAADLVIIPAQPSPTDLWATADTMDLVGAERIPHRVLLNRIIPNAKLTKKIISEYTNVMDTRLGNRVPFAAAMFDGRTVTEAYPGTVAAMEIKTLLSEMEALLFPHVKGGKVENELAELVAAA
jgi:chromosome partitioning protein